jgi:GntR family transcriptional regulator
MEISIDTGMSVPVFTQLIMQIKAAVLSGELEAGFALPSIRQLANDLRVNHNTVAKAYRLLERDSVIETRGHRGTFIHSDARSNSTVDLNKTAIEVLDSSVATLRDSGLTDSEIRIAFTSVMKSR